MRGNRFDHAMLDERSMLKWIQAGVVPIHAAALRVGDDGFLLPAAAGSGKTALVLAAAQRGGGIVADEWALLADGRITPAQPEILAVDYDMRQFPSLLRLSRIDRLRAALSERVGNGRLRRLLVRSGLALRSRRIDPRQWDPAFGRPVALRHVVWLERASQGEARLEPLDRDELIESMWACFIREYPRLQRLAGAYRQAAAAQLPPSCRKLLWPRAVPAAQALEVILGSRWGRHLLQRFYAIHDACAIAVMDPPAAHREFLDREFGFFTAPSVGEPNVVIRYDASLRCPSTAVPLRPDLRYADGQLYLSQGGGLMRLDVTALPSGRTEITLQPDFPIWWLFWTLESLLQLRLLERGYAVLHAGAVMVEGRGRVIAGGQGAGKTREVLRHASAGAGFLADELLPVSADGRALCYPRRINLKPCHEPHVSQVSRRLSVGERIRWRRARLRHALARLRRRVWPRAIELPLDEPFLRTEIRAAAPEARIVSTTPVHELSIVHDGFADAAGFLLKDASRELLHRPGPYAEAFFAHDDPVSRACRRHVRALWRRRRSLVEAFVRSVPTVSLRRAASRAASTKIELLITNQPAAARRMVARHGGLVRYVVPVETKAAQGVRRLLRELDGTEEAPWAAWAQPHRAAFRIAYTACFAQLNVRQASRLWWAMPFTNKNPLSTSLCRDTFIFMRVAQEAQEAGGRWIVVSDSLPLARQLRRWGRQTGISVTAAVRGGRRRRLLLNTLPLAPLAAFGRAVAIRFLARRPKAPGCADAPLDVVTTAFPPSKIDGRGWREAYFGPLLQTLRDTGRPLTIFAVLFESRLRVARALRRLRAEAPVLPAEACLSWSDLLRCAAEALACWMRTPPLRGPVVCDGHDITALVREAMRESCRSTSLFIHLCVEAGAHRLARRLSPARWFYPYENRAWEKMMLLGLRRATPGIRCIGHQHATMTQGHVNFCLGAEERRVTPLPDVIITVGEITQEWLRRDGHDPERLRIGCALRQSAAGSNGRLRERPAPVRRLLVALASSGQEYRDTFRFLCRAFAQAKDYDIRLRPHPEFPFEHTLGDLLGQATFPYRVDRGPLPDALAWADAVLYASSTISVEAFARGMPVVHLELGEVLDPDPLFGWNCFKWSTADPEQLAGILETINDLPEAEFVALQAVAQSYAAKYLRPVTTEGLDVFLKA